MSKIMCSVTLVKQMFTCCGYSLWLKILISLRGSTYYSNPWIQAGSPTTLTNRMWQECTVTIPGLPLRGLTQRILVLGLLPLAIQPLCCETTLLDQPSWASSQQPGSMTRFWVRHLVGSSPFESSDDCSPSQYHVEQKNRPGKSQRSNKMVAVVKSLSCGWFVMQQ